MPDCNNNNESCGCSQIPTDLYLADQPGGSVCAESRQTAEADEKQLQACRTSTCCCLLDTAGH